MARDVEARGQAAAEIDLDGDGMGLDADDGAADGLDDQAQPPFKHEPTGGNDAGNPYRNRA